MKDLEELKYFLGIEIARSNKRSPFSKKCVLELISDVGLSGGKIVKTPMELNLKLTSRKYDQHLLVKKDDVALDDVSSYRRSIGKLLYQTIMNELNIYKLVVNILEKKMLENVVQLKHVKTEGQLTNLFTKVFESLQHYTFSNKLGMKNICLGKQGDDR